MLLDALKDLITHTADLPSAQVRVPDDIRLEQVMAPREAFFAETEQVPIDKAAGRIAAEMLTPYPPGVPAALPGERLSEQVLGYLHTGVAAGMVVPDAMDASCAASAWSPENDGLIPPPKGSGLFPPPDRRTPMDEVWLLVGRGLLGGLLVMAFAVIGEATEPKRFAGIFAAAPAVAIAGMTFTVLGDGDHALAQSGLGMIAGSAALVAYCLLAVPLVRSWGALKGSVSAVVAWVLAAGACWAVVA